MQMSRCVVGSTFVSRAKPLVVAVSAAMLMCSTAYAASFGHSRIVSNSGQPLRIEVLVSQLSADDQRSLVVTPAPEAAWKQAALKPPVDLSTLQVHLKDGATPGSKVVQITSTEPFEQPVADLLLNVLTASGQQQYQVSILAHTRAGAPVMSGAGSGSSSAGVQTLGGQRTSAAANTAGSIRVRRGDTMFAIAQRNAVLGVSVYQMMIALQRANPQAFIHDNLNLVKAGATLSMPDQDALTAISDREARRLFLQQAQAFAAYRQGLGAKSSTALKAGSAAQGNISAASSALTPQAQTTPHDQVVLSSGSASSDAASDSHLATSKGIADSQQRVSQLEQNVKSLNQALQSQGEAAKNAFVDGAKGLGQSIADVAGSVAAANPAASSLSTGNSLPVGTPSSPGAGVGAGAGSDPASAGASVAGGVQAGAAQTGIAQAGGAVQSGAVQSGTAATPEPHSGAASPGAGARGSANASAGTSPIDPSSRAAESYVEPPVGGGGLGVTATPSSGAATGAGVTPNGASASKQATAPDQAAQVAEQISSKAETSVSWFQEHLLGVITGLLAFIVLVIAWLLRRANSRRDDDHAQAVPITEAMVQEQLDKINLDLREPPADESPATKK